MKSNIKYEISYCKETDLTFVMKYEYVEDTEQLESMEVVAFYCGEPDEGVTSYYINNPSVKATF